MKPAELRDYVQKLTEEAEELEGYIMDIALYSGGVLTYSEMLAMPFRKIKNFEKKLEAKLKKDAGKSGQEYL